MIKFFFVFIVKFFFKYLIKFFEILFKKKILIIKIYCDRIGHMGVLTDNFLRKQQLQKKNINYYYLGICQSNVPNEYFLKLIKRKISTIKIPLRIFNFICFAIKKESFFLDTSDNKAYSNYFIFNNTNINFRIPRNDYKQGIKLLEERGFSLTKKNWYVCFHNRTSDYLESYSKHIYNHKINFSYHNFRDFAISSYSKALNYIIEQGGSVIRVGHGSDEKIDFIKKPNFFFDFSGKNRTDFSDIFLISNCKFFLGGSAGISVIPYLFHKPLLMTNYTPIFVSSSPRKDCRAIPCLIWSIKEKRCLHFKEIFSSEIWKYGTLKQFSSNNLKILNNNENEILDATRIFLDEINSNINKTPSQKTKKIKEKFNALLPKTHPGKNNQYYLNSISDVFYLKNKDLIL